MERTILFIDMAVAAALIFWLLFSYQKRRKEVQANYYLKLQKTIMNEHYMVLQEQIGLTRRLRHDLANHIQTMESLEQTGHTEARRRYEEQLKELYTILKADGFCGNYVLDAMVVRRIKQCTQRGVEFRTSLRTVDGAGIDQTDLMIAFYELMEYGTKRAEAGMQKSFCLAGNQKNGYLFLRLTCPASKGQTPRKLSQLLSIELSQTSSIAAKYEGEVRGEVKDGTETIFFTVKLGEEGKE
ncbi:MAG: hypothetical protein Q4D16_21830 [Eubacteriales bacterium]|nr:hypothetical protein [Eubacteriales bacterium]